MSLCHWANLCLMPSILPSRCSAVGCFGTALAAVSDTALERVAARQPCHWAAQRHRLVNSCHRSAPGVQCSVLPSGGSSSACAPLPLHTRPWLASPPAAAGRRPVRAAAGAGAPERDPTWAGDDSDWVTEETSRGSGVPAEAAMQALMLGSWRLAGSMAPPFEALAAQIEGHWRELLPGELQLYPLPKKYKYCDTADKEGKGGIWAYRDAASPERGQPGWPRLRLENRAYQSRVFRKMHLELATRQDGFQVLHMVMYPRPEYDLPILSLDMVGGEDRVSLAVADPAPVSTNRSLPPVYAQLVQSLQRQYGMESNRTMPAWGQAIFSPLVVSLQPDSPDQVAAFLKYAVALVRAHLQLARQVQPIQSNRAARQAEVAAAQQRYCDKMLENNKTRRVLEAAFGPAWAADYMTSVMFDLATPREAQVAAEHK